MSKIFIPREEEMQILREGFFQTKPGSNQCWVLNGPNHIGKTTLVENLAKEYKKIEHPQVFYVPCSLKKVKAIPGVQSSYVCFWMNVVSAIAKVATIDKLKEVTNLEEEDYKELLKSIQSIYKKMDVKKFLKNAGKNAEEYEEESEEGYEEADDDSDMETEYTELTSFEVGEDVLDLFHKYTDLGIQILLSLDEFDLAATMFPENASGENLDDGRNFFNDLFTLSGKGGEDLNLAILLIGRRQIGTIQHSMDLGSDLEQAYESVILRGFNNSELSEYIQTFNVPLSDGMIKAIMFYCGRHPGMLMSMRNKIEIIYGGGKAAGEMSCSEWEDTEMTEQEKIEKENKLGQKKIIYLYREHGKNIRDVYKHMVDLMKAERINRNLDKSGIGTFAQEFWGPVYDATHTDNVEMLHALGFLTQIEIDKNGNKAESVYELAGITGAQGEKYKGKYEPIAPYFVSYIKDYVIANSEMEMVAMQLKIQAEVRALITDVYKEKYGAAWKDVLKTNVSQLYENFFETLTNMAEENDADERGVEYSVLNVVGYAEYGKIIYNNWELLKKYFSSFTKDELKAHFENNMKSSRDCVFHGNHEILSPDNAKKLVNLYQKILKDISNGKGTQNDNENAQASSSASGVTENSNQNQAQAQTQPPATQQVTYSTPSYGTQNKFSGKETVLYGITEQKGALAGYIIDRVNRDGQEVVKFYKARLSKKETEKLNLGGNIPQELKVKVDSYADGNPGGFFVCKALNV